MFVNWKARSKESGEWKKLNKEDRVFVNKLLIQFQRAGIELSEDSRKRIKKLSEELEDLTHQFSQNLLNRTGAEIQATEEELHGVPEEIVKKLAHADGNEKLRVINLDAFKQVFGHAENSDLRYKLQKAKDAYGMDSNGPLLSKIIQNRQESA